MNRIDLHENVVFGGRGPEARFVFAAVDRWTSGACRTIDVLVNVEFAVPVTCANLVGWANRWRALGEAAAFDETYRQGLQGLTQDFGTDMLIRTSERALGADGSWEMREFRLDSGWLRQTTVRQTPRGDLNRPFVPGLVSQYVNGAEGHILSNQHVVPSAVDGLPFLGGIARLVSGSSAWWRDPGVANAEARRGFSLATCTGCHGAETSTEIKHVDPTWPLGDPRIFSAFLAGPISVSDPASVLGAVTLDERDRRKQRLDALGAGCPSQLLHSPLRMEH